MAVWVVRAGEDLSSLPVFEKETIVGIGWHELPESPVGLTRTQLATLMAETYAGASPGRLNNYVGQVWNFINTMALGDLVIVPLERSKAFRVGQVVGKAQSRVNLATLCAVRDVEWLHDSVASTSLAEDFRNALGSIMTVFRPRPIAAERRLREVLESGHDPGPDSGGEDRSGAWVFQANPKRYDLLTSIEQGREETWAVNQHRQSVQPGDRVWFRITGQQAGVYAVGRVTSLPREESSEFGDWIVDVDIESKVEPPLLRSESDADPLLGSVTALSGLMGTNLSLATEADARLEELTAIRLIPVSGVALGGRLLERKINLDIVRLTEQVERDLLHELQSLSPLEFEEICALYLQVLGCDDALVVGAATAGTLGDGGIDVIGTLDRPGLPAIRLAVQAKRVSGGVGPNVVTQLRGSLGPGTYGMVITTGHFTKSAQEEANRSDRPQVRLVDGPELAHVLATNGIGVKSSAIALPRLDVSSLRAHLSPGDTGPH
ncbi:restriction endonuclease [Kribbella qitaiheensis]|uniref:restriction endonuclease n=1 Tax=Kribbella qitaiheensis TaxID=1544730 RepID=UPI0036223AD5